MPGCGKSFCRKTTLTKHTRRNHADAEGTYLGIGGPTTIMSNSISMNRCVLPPHSRSTFPQGLEQHYLAGLKVEDDPSANAYAFPMQQAGDYPGTPYSAPPMSSCPSSSTSYDGFDLGRRSSMPMSGYMSSSSHSFHSPTSNSSRICGTPNTLTPASEISQFPRTPDFRDARAFEAVSARPQFSHFSVANMAYGAACGPEPHAAATGFHDPVIAHSQPFAMMPNGGVIDHQDTSNLDPNLWDSGASTGVPVSSVGSQFYEQPRPSFSQQPTGGSNDFAPPSAGSDRFYFLRSASQQHQTATSST